MVELEVLLCLPDVNSDPIDASCTAVTLEIDYHFIEGQRGSWDCEEIPDQLDLDYIKVRSDKIPSIVCTWLGKIYEEMYQSDPLFKAQIDAAIKKDWEEY